MPREKLTVARLTEAANFSHYVTVGYVIDACTVYYVQVHVLVDDGARASKVMGMGEKRQVLIAARGTEYKSLGNLHWPLEFFITIQYTFIFTVGLL